MSKKIAFIIFFFIEFLLLTYWNGKFGPFASPIILFCASFGIGIIGITCSFKQSINLSDAIISNEKLNLIISILVPIAGVFILGFRFHAIFIEFPIDILDVSESDVIPQIGIMVNRFLNGEFPYSPINDWGYTLNPTYLPLQWMPFSIAKLTNIDYRWIPFSVLSLSFLLYQFRIFKNFKNPLYLIVFSAIPWLMWLMIINDEPKVFAYTIENLIAGYYLILGLSLLSKKPFFIGIGISLCLLSRFSLILWLPIFGLLLLLHNWRDLLKIIGVVSLALLIIYIIPFLSKDWHIFLNGMSHHTKAAVGEWQPYWQKPGDNPYHLFRGVGFAAFFFEYVSGDVLSRIKTLQVWHLGSIICSVIGLSWFYFFKKHAIDVYIYALAALKIYFCFFYYFIQIPYIYLMMVPLFTSLLLMLVVFEKKRFILG